MILRPRLLPHGCQCAIRAPSTSGRRRDVPSGHKRSQRFDEGRPTNREPDGRSRQRGSRGYLYHCSRRNTFWDCQAATVKLARQQRGLTLRVADNTPDKRCGVTEDLGPRWLRDGDVNGVIRGARPPCRFRCLCHRNFCHRRFGVAVGYNTRRETRWDVDQARRARAMIAPTMKEVCRTWRS
jgi:hypothetical protein